MQDDKFTFIQ